MKKTFFILFLLTVLISFSQSRKLSPDAEISIITIAEGKSLNDTWGHSAIRVYDATQQLDVVFNYGTYDFNTPNFYTKFMRGQLLYQVSVNNFYSFKQHYVRQNRAVVAQVLELTIPEKQAYFDYLVTNIRPENKNYLYDFFFDNCATRLRDVTTEILGDKVNYNDELLQGDYTFRQLIYQKLDKHPWGKFGIDIALSSIIDQKATSKQFTFLPSYIFENFKNATRITNGKSIPLIKKTTILYEHKPEVYKKIIFTPMLVFSILSLLTLGITYRDFKKKKVSKMVDFILLFISGLIGLLIVFLWFFTDHKTTANNYNIFWAFMPNLIMAFVLFKKSSFMKKYYLFLLLLLGLNLFFWLFKVQVYNWAMIPILIAFATRYFYNYWFLHNTQINY